MAETTVFPDCCAFIVLNKFKGGHPHSDPDDCISVKDCNAFLERNEKEYFNKRSGLLAILSEPQQRQIGKVFLERKWEVLLDGKMNPRTGTKVWMYYRDLNWTKAREKRIFSGTSMREAS